MIHSYESWEAAKPAVMPADLVGVKRPELIQWAKQRYPTISGKAWLRAKNEEIKHSLGERRGTVPEVVANQHRAWIAGEGGLERGSNGGEKAPKVSVQQEKKKVSKVTVPKGDTAAALELLIESIGSNNSGVTEARVEELIAYQIARTKPKTVKVQFKDREPVLVEGQHREFARLLDAIDLRDPVILTGPPGTGKSYAAHSASTVLSMFYGEISVGPTMTESRLLGYLDATGRYICTAFRQCYENGGVFLLDEADNGSGAVIAVLNNAMANGRCAFPDKLIQQHEDFVLVVAANTVGHGASREYLGRQGFDGPFRDRLTFIDWQIDEVLEDSMAQAVGVEHSVPSEKVQEWIITVRKIRKAIVKSGQVRVVASPRSTVKGIRYMAKGWGKEQILEAVLWKQVNPEVRKKITQAVV